MKTLLKWLAIVVAAVVSFVILGVIYVFWTTNTRMDTIYAFRPPAISITTDAASLAEGKRLFTTRGCADCHGPNLAGVVVVDDPAVGHFAGANLTTGRGGVAGERTDGDLLRAIRHGIGVDDKPLVFMPSHEFYGFNDKETGALIAYIRSAPPEDNEPGPSEPGPLGRLLLVLGEVVLAAEVIDHEAPRPATVVVGATEDFGRYMGAICVGCHGQNYAGSPIAGTPPDFPKAANITPDGPSGIGNWGAADFMKAMREGVRPDGSAINPFMPWRNFAAMTDTEIAALWAFLRTLEPVRNEF